MQGLNKTEDSRWTRHWSWARLSRREATGLSAHGSTGSPRSGLLKMSSAQSWILCIITRF